MNSEKLKEIWRANSAKLIDNYTDSEIESIVLNSMRKAINYYYPGISFWSFLIVFTLMIVGFMMQYAPPQLQVYGYALLVTMLTLLCGAIAFSEWDRRKAQRYTYDMPFKVWIQSRIHDLDKGIERCKKNWFFRYGFGLILLLIFCLIYIFTMGFVLKVLFAQFVSGLVALFITSTIGNKIVINRMVKSRSQLQQLLDQLEESEQE